MSLSLKFMWDGGYTKRFHTVITIREDTVGHHSYNVACIIMHLRPFASPQLLRAALKHDMAEHKTGDMPAPTKRALPDYRDDLGDKLGTFRDIYGKMEDDHFIRADVTVEILTPAEQWVLKFADALDGMRFCLQERKLGNSTIAECYYNFRDYCSELLFGEVLGAIDVIVGETPIHEHALKQDVEIFKHLRGEWFHAHGK